ncbi:large subunit ribosomal protein L17e [Nematocida sp. AWRm77]|nr:large subunit ribosomal protein L17e [Nematocida sp. AWRm77]
MKRSKTNYAYTPKDNTKAVKAAMQNAKISYKNTHQTVTILKGMWLTSALAYLDDVLNHKRCVPMRKFNGGIARTSQAKEFGVLQGRWPEKSVTTVKAMLKKMQNDAKEKKLSLENLKITHTMVNKAPIIHNRTYRAHGRVTAWNKSPCHIAIVAEEVNHAIPAEKPVRSIAAEREARRLKVLDNRGYLRGPHRFSQK